jgi:hypothetical protein
MTTEAALKAYLMGCLRDRYTDGLFWRAGAGPYAPSGIADILGCIDGRFVAIECKAPGRYKNAEDGLSPVQRMFMKKVLVSGGVFITTDNAEDCLDALDRWIASGYTV